MVRHHDPVDAEGSAAHRVVRVHDALDDEIALPLPAELLDVGPGAGRGRLLGYEVCHLVGRRAGRGILRPVAEQRHARAHVLGEPARMHAGFELGLEGHLQGPGETVAHVALALGSHGHVDGDDECGEPGVLGAFHLILRDGPVLGAVELVPAMLGCDAAQVLDQARRHAGHDERYVRVAGRAGEHQVDARAEETGQARGGDADGARVDLAEELGALIADGDVDAVTRHEANILE